MNIREATADDWPSICPFFREIVAARETYTYDPVVAADRDGVILGTARMHANHAGPGSHIASASFMHRPL